MASDYAKVRGNAAILDIETTGLRADFGYTLCACLYNPFTEEMQTFRVDDSKDPLSDRELTRDLIKAMNQTQLIITWYGANFDIPFINTRALKHGLKPPIRNYRRDLWYTSRYNLLLRNNKLYTVGQFIFGRSGKNAINPKIWNGAIRGERKALDYVVHHCELDVVETAKVYKKFTPFLGPLRKR